MPTRPLFQVTHRESGPCNLHIHFGAGSQWRGRPVVGVSLCGYCTGEHYVKAWERGYEVGVGTKPSGQPPQDDLNTDPDSPKPLKTPY